MSRQIHHVFETARESMAIGQPMTVGEITGAEEFLDMIESDALKGGEWVERFRGFLTSVCPQSWLMTFLP